MERKNIGEFEELVLLTVAAIQPNAYGISISDDIKRMTGREPDIGAIHSVLRRLEKKGLLKSAMGGSTSERGGRRKRLFEITPAGKKVLDSVYALRTEMYLRIPKLSFE